MLKEENQLTFADLGISSGKTSQEPSRQKKEKTSRQSSKKSSGSSNRKPPMCLCLKKDGQQPDASTMIWEDGALLGAYTTHSFGESPSVDAGSRLSQILEVSPHQKYTALLTMQGFGDYKENGVASACKSRDYKDSTDLVVSGIDARNGEEVYAIDHAITTGGNCTAQGPCVYKNIEATLKSSGVHAVSYESVDGTNCIKKHVRRLTPLECERLQGYPDGWTDIGEWVDSKGKRHDSSDSARYKALGNSIALPFWHWLMRRISAQYVGTPTLGSLFDGIGGFPLCWERINGKGTALWASEIEEFPIAVTKYHFGG